MKMKKKHFFIAYDIKTQKSSPVLLDAVIPLVPVREGGGVVDVLQDVDELVDVVSPPPELG